MSTDCEWPVDIGASPVVKRVFGGSTGCAWPVDIGASPAVGLSGSEAVSIFSSSSGLLSPSLRLRRLAVDSESASRGVSAARSVMTVAAAFAAFGTRGTQVAGGALQVFGTALAGGSLYEECVAPGRDDPGPCTDSYSIRARGGALGARTFPR